MENNPSKIIDIGCGFGLWLELLDKNSNNNTQLIGIDNDKKTLEKATDRAKKWKSQSSFLHINIENQIDEIPKADLILMMNMYGYIKNIKSFTAKLLEKILPNGRLVIKQYDGTVFKFGPMNYYDRQKIENSLMIYKHDYTHYNIDRIWETLNELNPKLIDKRFEIFQRNGPFNRPFQKYFNNEIEWMKGKVSTECKEILSEWIKTVPNSKRYFFETELILTIQP